MLGNNPPHKDLTARKRESAIEKGFYNLANAIAITAAEDYRTLRNRSFFRDNYEKKATESKIRIIEKFFGSEYGDILCQGNAAYIMHNLREEFE